MPFASAGANITATEQINDGVIVDADINAAAAIDYSKLDLTNDVVDADIDDAAGIALTKIANGTQGGVMIRTTAGVLTETPVGDSGQVLTSGGTGADPVWADLTAPVIQVVSTCFETIARFTTSLLGGTTSSQVALGASGLQLYKHYSYGINAVGATWKLTGKASTLYSGSPMFTAKANFALMNNSVGSIYIGLGNPTLATTGHTFTVGHTGFKVIRTGGVNSLYATQADGSTETASSALTTLANGDDLDLYVRINSTTSVDYFWRKNGGSISAATNLTTNMPAGTSQTAQFSISCDNADNAAIEVYVYGATYTK